MPQALARVLYDLLVARGRLGQTYPDFVRDVMVAAIPSPGVWVDAALVESDGSTVVMTRPTATIGETAERTQEFTDAKDRFTKHRFALTVGPLTSRFVCVRRGDLKEGRDIEVAFTADGQPSDAVLLLTLRSDHLLHTAPKRPAAQRAVPPQRSASRSATQPTLRMSSSAGPKFHADAAQRSPFSRRSARSR